MMEDHAPGQEKHFSSGEHVQEMVEGPVWPTAELSGERESSVVVRGVLGDSLPCVWKDTVDQLAAASAPWGAHQMLQHSQL